MFDQGPIYMVLGTRDNPSPKLPTNLFKNSINRLHEVGETIQLGEASCLASAGRVTLAGKTTFSLVNNLALLPKTRQQNLKCACIK